MRTGAGLRDRRIGPGSGHTQGKPCGDNLWSRGLRRDLHQTIYHQARSTYIPMDLRHCVAGDGARDAVFGSAISTISTSVQSARESRQTTELNWRQLSWRCAKRWPGRKIFLVWLSFQTARSVLTALTNTCHCGKLTGGHGGAGVWRTPIYGRSRNAH